MKCLSSPTPTYHKGMKIPTTYYVWRRSDGYVGCTAYDPRQYGGTFDVLLTTQEWPLARKRVEAERIRPVVRDQDHFQEILGGRIALETHRLKEAKRRPWVNSRNVQLVIEERLRVLQEIKDMVYL